MAYKNEAAFSRALSNALKEIGAIVTRIETGMTSQGVPDMFVQIAGGDVWLELKNMPSLETSDIEKKGCVKVAWRPGQVAWAFNYWRMHRRSRFTLTIIAGKKCFYIIKMNDMFVQNKVDADCVIAAESLAGVAAGIQLAARGNLKTCKELSEKEESNG